MGISKFLLKESQTKFLGWYQLGRHRTNEPMSCCFVNAQDVTDQICSQLVGYPQIRSRMFSGQIIATSHDRFPPNGGLVREIPLFQGNLGW